MWSCEMLKHQIYSRAMSGRRIVKLNRPMLIHSSDDVQLSIHSYRRGFKGFRSISRTLMYIHSLATWSFVSMFKSWEAQILLEILGFGIWKFDRLLSQNGWWPVWFDCFDDWIARHGWSQRSVVVFLPARYENHTMALTFLLLCHLDRIMKCNK